MFCHNPWSAVLNDDHRTTDSTAIACDVDRLVVVVDIHADKLAKLASSAKLSEIGHESCWIACEADDGTVDVDNKGMLSVNLHSRSETDVYKKDIISTNVTYSVSGPSYLRHQA
jgi:hypothetical protein